MAKLTITFAANNLPQEILDEIYKIAQFCVDKYIKEEKEEVRDLDPIRVVFVDPSQDPNAYGRAYDGEHLDEITIRADAIEDDKITERGLNTLCHEFIHLAQYITDFERRYDVPYLERPQEKQAFELAPKYAEAYGLPYHKHDHLPLKEKRSNKVWVVVAVVVGLLLLVSNAFAEPVQDEGVDLLRNHVLYNNGTEHRFTSILNDENRAGTYVDVVTGKPLFRSETKFDSGTGWPSFHTPVSLDNITLKEEWRPWGSIYEVRSADNERHYGHLFLEKQWPEGRRFCINGVALKFIPDEES